MIRTVVSSVILGVGLVATGLSGFYTYQWFRFIGESVIVSLMLSMISTLFMILALELGLYLRMCKRLAGLSWLLLIVYALLAVYSVSATVAAQYIGVMTEAAAREEAVSEALSVETQREGIEARLAEIRSDRENYVQLREKLSNIATESTTDLEKVAEYRTTFARINDERARVSKEISRLDDESASLRNTLSNLSRRDVEIAGRDVFLYYSRLLNIERDTLQFALALLRAIILDVVNVLSFWVLASGALTHKIVKPLLSYEEAAEEVASIVSGGSTNFAVVHTTPQVLGRLKNILEAKKIISNGRVIDREKVYEALKLTK